MANETEKADVPEKIDVPLSGFIGVKVVILNDTEVDGGFLHHDGKNILIVKNKPKVENEGIEITKIAGQIKDFIQKFSPGTSLDFSGDTDLEKLEKSGKPGKDENVTLMGITWPKELWKYAKETKLFIDEVFLKVVLGGAAPDYEFAFAIRIEHQGTGDGGLKDAFPLLDIKELSLMLWKTKNEQILKEMNIEQVQKLLESTKKDANEQKNDS